MFCYYFNNTKIEQHQSIRTNNINEQKKKETNKLEIVLCIYIICA